MSELRLRRNPGGGGAPSVRASALLACVLLLGACSSPADPGPAPDQVAPATPGPSSSGPAERGITDPPGVIVVNGALGAGDRRLVTTAVEDVKATGLWKELTGHLYSVRIGIRPGEERIPEDGHLADALRTLKLDGDLGGIYCQITFYSAAMAGDLERVGEYFDQGLIATPPPSERQFYAAILGHELAHCLGKGKGEQVAQAWEKKVLDAVKDAGIE